ncbi:MAG: GNAT family N-acetyltransferase [Spirochaetales bacterium]|nr:GNAT family N-acetyltransferase [Spirochaetales bacterium]
MKIRNAQNKDIDDLVRLLKGLTELEASFDFDEEAHRKGLTLLIQSQPASCVAVAVAVAEENGNICGMCTGQTVISTAMGGPSVWVEDVVVHPDYQRRGVGSKLLDFLEEWGVSRGAARSQLLIDNDNESALKFYKQKKWQETNFSCLRKMS